jgi:hypothetical protein
VFAGAEEVSHQPIKKSGKFSIGKLENNKKINN